MPLDIGLKHQMSMESNPFDCADMDDDLMALTSGDLDVLGNEDQGKSASFISPEQNPAEEKPSEETPTPGGPEEEDKTPTVGTPYYLAPEIWKHKKYGKESDVWALGVILYEICCLKYPFPASELQELEKKILNDKVDRHPNGVKQEFVEIFTKMLKKDPLKRPCIEEIIYSDIFQEKARKNLITLPLKLNKSKLQEKFGLWGSKLDEELAKMGITMTDKEKKMAGIQINSNLESKQTSKIGRANGQSLLNVNLKNQ